MPFYKVTEKVIGTAERSRSGYIFIDSGSIEKNKEEAVNQAQSGSIEYDEDKIDINAELTVYSVEEINVN